MKNLAFCILLVSSVATAQTRPQYFNGVDTGIAGGTFTVCPTNCTALAFGKTGVVSTLTGSLVLTQGVATSGSPTAFTFTGAAHTNLANAEASDVVFSGSRTVNLTGGGATIAAWRQYLILPETLTAAAAQTITNIATLDLVGSPTCSTNVTCTNGFTLRVESGQSFFGGNIVTSDNVANVGSPANSFKQVATYRVILKPQVIAAASSITINPASGAKVRINLSGTAITSITYTAGNDGDQSTVCVAEDGTGTRTIPTTWTNVRFAFVSGANTYVASTGANRIDCINFIYDSTATAWLETSRAMNL